MNSCFGECWAKCMGGFEYPSFLRPMLEAEYEEFQQRVTFLWTVPLFLRQLPPECVSQVARELKQHDYSGGECIVREGELGNALYIVESGEVVATVQTGTRSDGHPSREVRARLSAGDYFGGHALVEKRRNLATMSAGGRGARLLYISRERFEALHLNQFLTFPKRHSFYEGKRRRDRQFAERQLPSADADGAELDDSAMEFVCSAIKANPNLRAMGKVFSDDTVRAVACAAQRVLAQPGKEVAAVGQAGTFFIIESGHVEVVVNSQDDLQTCRTGRRGSTEDVAKASAEHVVRASTIAECITRRRAFLERIIVREQKHDEPEQAGDEPERKVRAASVLMPKMHNSNEGVPKRARSQPLVHEKFSIGDHVRFIKDYNVSSRGIKADTVTGHVAALLPNGDVVVHFADRPPARCKPSHVHHVQCAKPRATLAAGESFGELSMMYNTYRIGSYRVPDSQTEPTVLYAIPHRSFRECFSSRTDPKIEEWVQLLAEVSALSSLRATERADLAATATGEAVFAPDEAVLVRGRVRVARQWYIVASGTAVTAWSAEGDNDSIQSVELGRGEHFGSHSLLGSCDGDPIADATVTAGPNGLVCLCLDQEVLKAVSEYADLAETDWRRKWTPPTPQNTLSPRGFKRCNTRKNQYIVDPSKLVTERMLGRGAYGQVMLQTDPLHPQTYALKRMSKRGVRKAGTEKHINTERKIHAMLNSPFIIMLYCSYRDAQCVYILLEAATGGTLAGAIESVRRRQQVLTGDMWLRATWYYVACVCAALEHLHEQKIAHRDLKPENVLLTCTGQAKLCDFGFARFILRRAYTFCGTPEYMAPEMIDLPHGHDHRVDWWALGVILFELLSGQTPFGHGDDDIVFTVRESQQAHPFPEEVLPSSTPALAEDLSRSLLVATPKHRLGSHNVGKVRDHSWFKQEGMGYEDVLCEGMPPPNLQEIFPGKANHSSPSRIAPVTLSNFEDDDVFKEVDAADWRTVHTTVCSGVMTKCSGNNKCSDAMAVTSASTVVRITGLASDCEGVLRFGLVADPKDDVNFSTGYFVAVMPSLRRPKADATSYLVPKRPQQPITLTIDNGRDVQVFCGGELVHTMTPRGGGPPLATMHAKVFLSNMGDVAQVHAFEEYPEEHRNWDAEFELPPAVAALKRAGKAAVPCLAFSRSLALPR